MKTIKTMFNGVTFAVHSLRMVYHHVQTFCHNLTLQSVSETVYQYSVFLTLFNDIFNSVYTSTFRNTDLGQLRIKAAVVYFKALCQFGVFLGGGEN